MVMGGDLTWGGEHSIQCTGDILWNCALKTCIILLTSVTPINLIRRKYLNKYLIKDIKMANKHIKLKLKSQ